MRRCKEMIMLTKTHKSLYIYNDNKQSYQLIGEGKNNIPAQFAAENNLQKENLKKLCSDFDVSYVESYDSVQQSFIDVTNRIDTKIFTG